MSSIGLMKVTDKDALAAEPLWSCTCTENSFCLEANKTGNKWQPEICLYYLCRLLTRWYHTCNAFVLTLPMASAMDSTMPPTMPPSLAASFKVTMMSSTASFISCEASEMASWVWDAWRHSQLINVSLILLV